MCRTSVRHTQEDKTWDSILEEFESADARQGEEYVPLRRQPIRLAKRAYAFERTPDLSDHEHWSSDDELPLSRLQSQLREASGEIGGTASTDETLIHPVMPIRDTSMISRKRRQQFVSPDRHSAKRAKGELSCESELPQMEVDVINWSALLTKPFKNVMKFLGRLWWFITYWPDVSR